MTDMIPKADADAAVGAVIEEAARAAYHAVNAYWVDAQKPLVKRKHGGSGMSGSVVKEIRALRPDAMAALDRVRAESRKVKPLVWRPPLAGFYQAMLPFGGKLEIMWDQVHGVETFILHPGTPERRHHPTLEAAKAAAQADYEARILATLEAKE